MKMHDLKCWPEPFRSIENGDKSCDIRKDDRGFQVGDLVTLFKYDPDSGWYCGKAVEFEISHIQRGFGLKEGHVALSWKSILFYEFSRGWSDDIFRPRTHEIV